MLHTCGPTNKIRNLMPNVGSSLILMIEVLITDLYYLKDQNG